jgi:hypothetical protein
MCEFQSLYYSDDGYVVQCKDCGYYQLAFGNTMLSLSAEEYIALCKMVKNKRNDIDYTSFENTRNIVIPTPSQSLFLLLTKEEANRFHKILEAADTEEKAQQLMALFHP